jgi:hypothetical protein
MLRKLSWPALVGLAVTTLLAGSANAQVTGTVVLKTGERHTGRDIDYRFDRRLVSVRTGQDTQPRVDVGQVAYVDFGGAPEVQLNLTGSQEAVVLKDGNVIRGQIIEMAHENSADNTSPFLVIIRDSNGQEQRLPVARVGRVYFAGGATSTTATSGTGAGTAATSGTGASFVVSGKQQWTPTGIVVRRGQTLTFNTTGEVQLSTNGDDLAAPAGSKSGRMAVSAPLPQTMAGALIGRVGNGQPFVIGNQSSVIMPANGQLFLGVNDDDFNDNSGEFRVEIARNPTRR